MRTMQNCYAGLSGLVAAAILLMSSSTVSATDRTWSVESGDWSNALNWGGTKPTLSDDAYINNGGTATINSTGEACNYLYLGNANAGTIQMSAGELTSNWWEYVGHEGTGTFNQTGGTNRISSAFGRLYLGFMSGSNGSYNLSGTGSLKTSDGVYIGDAGTGVFTHSGGTNTTNDLCFGFHPGSSGTYYLSGTGILNCSRSEYIGYSGTGAFIQTGGTHSFASLLYAASLYLGFQPGSSGSYDLSGTGRLDAKYENIGVFGTGTFTQSGGTHSTRSIALGLDPSASGTYHLEGGTLILKSLSGGSGTAAFNFGGGTLQTSDAMNCSLPMTLTAIGGNANVNTNGFAVNLSGILSDVGGLNKLGTGTLTLSGVDTYSGDTNIQAGTLALDATGTIDSSPVIDVGSGAFLNVSAKTNGLALKSIQTLKGLGTVVGKILAESGSHIAPGESVGTLAINDDLKLEDGAKLDYELGAAGSSDLISMSGSTLTLSGQDFLDFTFTPRSGFDVGTYTLIDAKTISGNLGSNVTGTIVGNYMGELFVSDNHLMLKVVPEPGTMALLAAASLGLLGWNRGRKR